MVLIYIYIQYIYCLREVFNVFDYSERELYVTVLLFEAIRNNISTLIDYRPKYILAFTCCQCKNQHIIDASYYLMRQ